MTNPKPADTASNFKNTGAAVASIVIMLFVVAWSVVVLFRLNTPPHVGKDGVTVTYDTFQRAKDIFVLILPLLTTAAGFWLGSVGTANAKAEAANAKQETSDVKDQKEALLSASRVLPANTDLLTAAKDLHPEAFGLSAGNGA